MGIIDLFESSIHRNNMAHFSAILNIALVDGELNSDEQLIINRFVKKLDITEEEYKEVLKTPNKYPIIPQNNIDDRLERLLDLFKIILSDHRIDKEESDLVLRYAIQLGFSEDSAKSIIKKSLNIFNADIDFDDYKKILSII
ncbi:TerB family tellurite resistance protein [Tenacibaculum sp. 190524A02b]|uniref:TerB family tellurite resistance protein n=1 Tax=Tenacibaculum vairaonense TaxID=3137860 RepID=UPI0032B17306